ncbi:MAG TPA: sigma-70 family RNA polymerase sigma factor [Pirellulales bacterium]|jgi:RNA polymerase sigma factor for flagellar operon FliA|nr:sigma-70 family RNA polymerase sigma factor [Pirellulales bacterium]
MTAVNQSTQSLIEDCQGLVKSLALKIHRTLPASVELDDLIGYGQVGLAEAARDFDPNRGGQFTTFAFYRIRGAIYDGLSKMSWLKRSQARKIKYEQMAGDVLRLAQEDTAQAAAPTAEDDANWFKNVTRALSVVYLSSRAGSDEESEWECADDAQPPPAEVAAERESHQRLRELIDQLPAESRSLIRAVYFEGLTLTDAGQQQNIGKAWASRLHAKTLDRLARALRATGIAE